MGLSSDCLFFSSFRTESESSKQAASIGVEFVHCRDGDI